jgi:hypothetical protein
MAAVHPPATTLNSRLAWNTSSHLSDGPTHSTSPQAQGRPTPTVAISPSSVFPRCNSAAVRVKAGARTGQARCRLDRAAGGSSTTAGSRRSISLGVRLSLRGDSRGGPDHPTAQRLAATTRTPRDPTTPLHRSVCVAAALIEHRQPPDAGGVPASEPRRAHWVGSWPIGLVRQPR